MIRRYFSFIPGVTPRVESQILMNTPTWDDFLNTTDVFLTDDKHSKIKSSIIEAKENLDVLNHTYFVEKLDRKEHFRLYDVFNQEGKIGYLDIETTGLSKERNKITTICVFDGKETKTFIHGISMDEDELREYLSQFKMFVTFNGICFDMPFIEHKFPSIKFNQLHIDLRWVCRRVGLSGGLKNIEREVGLAREGDLADVDGREAVRLWKKYELKGDEAALDLLVRYNKEDVIKLESLMERVLERAKVQNI